MNPQPPTTDRIKEAERLARDARKMQDAAERERMIDEQWKIWEQLEREASIRETAKEEG